MKIATIEPIAVRVPLTKPIKMSGVELVEAENILVRIQSHDGTIGWGEAASAPNMTGETVESMMAALRYLRPFLLDRDAADFAAVHDEMDWRMVGNHAAKSAIDMALHDLVARARGVPLHALLGPQQRTRVPVLWMVASGSVAGDVRDAAQRKAQGFTAYKIKVGAETPAQDGARTRAVCETLGPGLLICADVNQAWTVDQAIAYLRAIGDAPLDFLEQPVRAHDLAGMARVASSTRVAIGADEGLHGIETIERHHAMGAARGGSLKTIKFGGVGPAFRAGQLCSRLGLHVNLASKMAESGIATAALLHLAAALPSLDWGVSPTSQYLADDLVKEPIKVIEGHCTVPSGPGLGVEIDAAKIEQYRCR